MPNVRFDLDMSKKMSGSSTKEPITTTVNYSDQVFINAAKLFQIIHRRKPPDKILVNYGSDAEPITSQQKDDKVIRWSYDLAYKALQYQDLLETILLVSGFYQSQLLPVESTSLVVVMLYDFQNRKFQPRCISNTDEVIEDVREVEKLLHGYKTKLAAALAKSRIKSGAPTIEYILPETVRKQEQRASTLPVYAWINTAKVSITDVFNALKQEGFTQINSSSELDGYTFCVDQHCQDLLIFPPQFKEELGKMEMVAKYELILQDKSHSLAVHSVKALLNFHDDIIVANPYPEYTIAHMSVLTSPSSCNIYVCGVKSESREEEMLDLFRNMECGNVKMLKESFTDIEPSDPRLQKAKSILLLPQCSGSGISDPVDFILNEYGDTALLQDLSQGYVSSDRINGLAKQQLSELNHAMKFRQVHSIVYCTRSIYPEENESVIRQALQYKMEGIKGLPYRISPPLIPLCSSEEVESASENFFKMELPKYSNGCFLAVLTREDPSESAPVQDVLARAASKGLLDGIEVPESSKKLKKKSKTTLRKSPRGASVTQAKINEFLNRENNLINPKIQEEAKNRKPTKSRVIPTNKTSVKTTNNSSAISSISERQPVPNRPKPEAKIVLRPAEILLPPVTVPTSMTPPNVKIRDPVYYQHQRWHAKNRNTTALQSYNMPTLPQTGRSKEAQPSTAVRHPRPWH